jgi:hypothetical protein
METKRSIQRIDETTSWLIEEISKLDKSLSKPTKRERRHNLIKLEMKRGLLQLIPMKYRGTLLRNIFKTFTLIH